MKIWVKLMMIHDSTTGGIEGKLVLVEIDDSISGGIRTSRN